MLPSFRGIDAEHVVEYHRAQSQQEQFADVPHDHRRIVTIGFEWFQPLTVFVAKGKNVFTDDVAQETKFKAFVHGIRGNNNFAVALDEQGMASFRKRI